MRTLDPSKYQRLLPLIEAGITAVYLPTLHAVLEGNAEATIFVDRYDDPTRALVALAGGWVFPLGTEDVKFACQTLPELLGQCDTGYPLSAIWPTSPGWEKVLANSYALWMTRIHFTYMGDAADRQVSLPTSDVTPIEFGPMAPMAEAIDPWLRDRWIGVASMQAPTFGYCVTIDGELASAAWAGLMGMHVAQFDVVTNPAHLRKGYGEAVCRAMLAHCASENLVPYWSTDLANTPSCQLALKLGFAPTSKSVAYVWCRELMKPDPKWGSDIAGIDVNPPGSSPAVQITLK